MRLGEGILPGAVRRREDVPDRQALQAVAKLSTVDLIAITEQIGRGGVVPEGVDNRLGGPVGDGGLGHVEVDDMPAMVGEHDVDEEHA